MPGKQWWAFGGVAYSQNPQTQQNPLNVNPQQVNVANIDFGLSMDDIPDFGVDGWEKAEVTWNNADSDKNIWNDIVVDTIETPVDWWQQLWFDDSDIETNGEIVGDEWWIVKPKSLPGDFLFDLPDFDQWENWDKKQDSFDKNQSENVDTEQKSSDNDGLNLSLSDEEMSDTIVPIASPSVNPLEETFEESSAVTPWAWVAQDVWSEENNSVVMEDEGGVSDDWFEEWWDDIDEENLETDEPVDNEEEVWEKSAEEVLSDKGPAEGESVILTKFMKLYQLVQSGLVLSGKEKQFVVTDFDEVKKDYRVLGVKNVDAWFKIEKDILESEMGEMVMDVLTMTWKNEFHSLRLYINGEMLWEEVAGWSQDTFGLEAIINEKLDKFLGLISDRIVLLETQKKENEKGKELQEKLKSF